MTAAALPIVTQILHAENGSGRCLQIGHVLWLSLAAILVISLPNLADPMIRYDDYPALFADADMFWNKTLHEGRWINYIWHLRGYVTPSWLNYLAYQVLWAIFAAATATVVIRQRELTFFKGALALIILVSPSALLISLWFNTLLPGLALVTAYALLACRISDRSLRLLLPIFVVLTFMAYTTYPLLLLAICLFKQEKRSVRNLVGLLCLFAFSILAAVLLTYAINWQVHGIFGVPLADWRNATPAHSLQDLYANLPKLWMTLDTLLAKSSFDYYPAQVFHLVLFTGSAFVLLRYEPMEALYLYAGLFIGLALVVCQVLKLGVSIPPRTFIFAWVFYGIAAVRAAEILSTKHPFAGRMARNAVMLIVGSYLLQSFQQATQYRSWQVETRQISQMLAETPAPLLIRGHPMKTTSGLRAGVQSDTAFQFRIRQLTGRNPILCSSEIESCSRAVVGTKGSSTAGGFPATIIVDELGTTILFSDG